MSEYRLNVRFNLCDTEHTAIIDYLNNLDKEKIAGVQQMVSAFLK